MSSGSGREQLRSALLGRSWDLFERAIHDAVQDPDGDGLLAEASTRLTGDRLTFVAAALGEVRGPDGAGALRGLLALSGPGTEQTRCAALLALAKREGANASAELATALKSRNAAVRDYAVLGLAAFGDDRAWDDILAHLTRRLRVPHRRVGEPPEVAVAVIYLLTNVGGRPEGVHALVNLLRGSWDNLTVQEHAWLTGNWPQALPGGPPASQVAPPNGHALRQQFAAGPLFTALSGPRRYY